MDLSCSGYAPNIFFLFFFIFFDHHLGYSDLYASSSILPEFDPYPGSTVYFPIFFETPPPFPSQVLIMSFDMVRHHAYMHTQHVSYNTKCLVMLINHQSQSVIQVPVIYHLGNILIALWCNSYACEIRFTVELQFCQKLHRDH